MLDETIERTAQPTNAVAPVPAVASAEEGQAMLERVRVALNNATYEPKIAVERIRPMPNQPRKHFNPERLLMLSESIKAIGQTTPGFLRSVPLDPEGRDYELVDGERRWQAIIMGGVPTFRAMIVDIDDEAAQFIMSVIANFNREGHTTLEIADAIRVSHEQLKLKMGEIGEMLGFSEGHCNNLYSLRKLVPQVRELLDPERGSSRRLPVSAAIKISRIPQQHQISLAARVMRREVSLRTLDDEVVSISERHGLPIQKRIAAPKNQRTRVEEKIGLVKRANVDLQKRLEDIDSSVLDGWASGAAMAHRGDLAVARDALAASIRVVDGVVRRKSARR